MLRTIEWMDANRSKLANALSDFWYGGDGPSHGELERVFDDLDLEVGGGSKRDRVREAVTEASEAVLPRLVSELVDLLNKVTMLVGPQADTAAVSRLQKRLRPYNLQVADDGELVGGTRLGIEPEALIDVPALRDHIRRIHVALEEDDSALLLGSAKELLESTSKLVLGEVGAEVPDKFPSLLKQALEVLGLHSKSVSGEDEIAAATRKILGGLQQIGLGVNELRNDHGTGHGRAGGVKLGLRQARLAAGSAVVLASVMIDTLEDPGAPWRKKVAQPG